MINLTAQLDTAEINRKMREVYANAKQMTSGVATESEKMDIAMMRFKNTLISTAAQIGGGIGLFQLAKQIATTRGEFQQLEVAFKTLLQSEDKAKVLMSEMVTLAAKTPFDLKGVANGARQLLAYGFSAGDVTNTLTRLGNVAAGLGLPLERLTYLYGTTAVQGRLYARDMLQFTSSGIPLLQSLADMYGKSTEEINAMVSAGKIGFEDVKKVIENMTNSGGKFYNLMQEQSKTINGQISNLGDSISMMFNEIGQSQEGAISGAISGAAYLVEHYDKVLKILVPLVATYGLYKASLIAVAAAQKAVVTASSIKAFFELAKSITSAKDAMLLLNVATKANPLGLFLSAITGIIIVLAMLSRRQKEANEAIDDATKSIRDEYTQTNILIKKLGDSNLKEKDRKDILDELKRINPEIVKGVNDEASAYEQLTQKLEGYNKQKLAEITVKSFSVKSGFEDVVKELAEARENTQNQSAGILDVYSTLFSRFNTLIVNNKSIPEDIKSLFYSVFESNAPETEKVELLFSAYDSIIQKIQSSQGAYSGPDRYVFQDLFGDLNIDKYRKSLRNLSEANDEYIQKADLVKTKINNIASAIYSDQKQRAEFVSTLMGSYFPSEGNKQTGNKTETSNISSDLKSATKGYNNALVAWNKGVKDNLETSVVSKLKQEVEEAKKRLEDIQSTLGIDPKAAKTAASEYNKLQQEITDAQLKNLLASEKERIDAMADGRAKELEQIELARKAKIAAIDQEEKEFKEKYKGKDIPKDQQDLYTTRRDTAGADAKAQTTQVEAKYADDVNALYAQIGDVFLSEEERKRNGIKETYDEYRKQLKQMLDGGTITQKEYDAKLPAINAAQKQAELKPLLDQYQTYTDQRKEIEKKFNDDIATMQADNADGKYDENIKVAGQKKKDALSGVDTEQLKKNLNWEAVFGNLDKVSTQALTNVRNSLKEYMATAKDSLSPTDLKTLTDAYEQLNEKISDRTPGEVFKAAVENYKKANGELKKAKEDEEKASGTEQEAEAQKKVTAALDARRAAQIELNESIRGYADKAGQVLEAANALTGMLEDFGVKIPESIKGALDGIGQVVDGLASIDITKPFSIVTGVFKMIGGIGKAISSLFTGDNRKEKEIQRLQEQVDALQVSYDALSKSIDKAYSTDAKGLIEDQNKILEQQKILLQQQINEERSKKDVDDDRIIELDNQIKAIDKTLEENKEKAIDAIFGEDLKSAIENFATAYADAWAKGEDKAESAKDTVRKMMRQMVTESIKAAIQASGAMEKIRKKLEEFYADKVLTGWEQEYIYNMGKDLQEELDRQFGWADSLMKDEKDKESQQEAASKGFNAMDQDTGNGLDGRFTVMSDILYKSMIIQEHIREMGLNIADATFNIRDLAIIANNHLAAISRNTSVLSDMQRELRFIRENTAYLK